MEPNEDRQSNQNFQRLLPSPKNTEPSRPRPPSDGQRHEELRDRDKTYKCLHCHDGRYVYLPIKDVNDRLFGKAIPCPWCATVKGGLWRDTGAGQDMIAYMRSLGCEVPR